MKKIALIGEMHPDGINILKNNEYEVVNITDFSNENLLKQLKDVDGIGLRTAQLNKQILSSCNSLKIISRHGVGYDNIDLDFLNKNKIALAITGTSNSVSVCEHVMTMFLYLYKIINKSDQLVRMGKFKDKKTLPDFFELYKKNILILGFGRIGKALAKRCLGFESNIYVYDPFIDKKIILENNFKQIDLIKGLEIADLISVHLPLNNSTKNIISKNEFLKMKKNCVVINTSRGGIINERDLFWALKNNKIHGAGIDVYETEPPETNNPLFKLDNIVLSPHNAALTLECRKRMSIETCENIINYLENKSSLNLNNIINKEKINLDI